MSFENIENWDSRKYTPAGNLQAVVHDNAYYLKCMLGGVLSCGLTHTAVVPLDIAKCKMQGVHRMNRFFFCPFSLAVFPEKYKGLLGSLSTMVKEEGASGLKLGWAPTLIGYSMQGLFKFGLYEYFKGMILLSDSIFNLCTFAF
jgi:solute carrier family 25 phosphate transporter 3